MPLNYFLRPQNSGQVSRMIYQFPDYRSANFFSENVHRSTVYQETPNLELREASSTTTANNQVTLSLSLSGTIVLATIAAAKAGRVEQPRDVRMYLRSCAGLLVFRYQ